MEDEDVSQRNIFVLIPVCLITFMKKVPFVSGEEG